MLAGALCSASYVLLHLLGMARFRSEFLGASLMLGVLGAGCLAGFRLARGPLWLHAAGVFLINWLFAACALSFLAV